MNCAGLCWAAKYATGALVYYLAVKIVLPVIVLSMTTSRIFSVHLNKSPSEIYGKLGSLYGKSWFCVITIVTKKRGEGERQGGGRGVRAWTTLHVFQLVRLRVALNKLSLHNCIVIMFSCIETVRRCHFALLKRVQLPLKTSLVNS